MAAILVLLAGIAFLAFQIGLKTTSEKAASFPAISLGGVQRILVLAPHPDDETLATGGLILAARQAGIQVRVVIATNGDGSRSTAIAYLHAVRPNGREYIQIGKLRQQESLAALKVLGVPAGQVDFLGYPDRGSPFLWTTHWSASNPYRSTYTREVKSVYPLTYDSKAVYSGEDYLADLTTIINAYRPDLIVYPHPEDIHPDHWGLNVFTRLAITQIEHNDPAYHPREYTYLVHRRDYPVVQGYNPQADLIPPPAVYAISHVWVRWDLTPQQTALKLDALMQYRTQLLTLRKLMESFARKNELFAPVVDARLTTATGGNPLDPASWVDASGRRILAIQLDPVHDTLMREAVPAADLVALYAARGAANTLWLCSETDDPTAGNITYILRLKALTGSGVLDYGAQSNNPPSGWHKAVRSGVFTCDNVNLADLGNPYAIYVGAATEGPTRITIDQTAWQMIWITSNGNP